MSLIGRGLIGCCHGLQDVKSAAEFYEGKIKDLGSNITDLETIVQNKSNTLRAVEEGEKTRTLLLFIITIADAVL